MSEIRLRCGDSLDVLKSVEDNTIDSLVTDPPYGLSSPPDISAVLQHWLNGDTYNHKSAGFAGKDWDSFVPGPNMWKEVFRVMKPGAHGLVFAGTRTVDLMGIALRMAGFEIRDTLMWCYGSGFPKSQNLGNGTGTALKPALEPIILIRKPLSEKTIAQNVLKWGTGGLNIDGCRVPSKPGEYDIRHYIKEDCFQNKNPKESQFQVKPQPEGRWPANLIHDGSSEVVSRFPNSKSCDSPSSAKSGGTILPGSRSQGRIYPGEDGSAARFFYCTKASKSERGSENNHPTVKPIKLMEYLVKLITPKGGTALDPFMGSGTTGIACKLHGFGFYGVELGKEYFKIAEDRIKSTEVPGSLEDFLMEE